MTPMKISVRNGCWLPRGQRMNLPLPELLDGLIADVRAFADGNDFSDDVCLLGMEVARTGGSG